MTKQELLKLSRLDLMEMLLEASRENDQLRRDLEDANRRLEERAAIVDQSQSLSEAALRLNGVLEAAQAAADQYLENIRMRDDQQDYYSRMRQETLDRCTRMVQNAQAQADDYLRQVRSNLLQISSARFVGTEPDEET